MSHNMLLTSCEHGLLKVFELWLHAVLRPAENLCLGCVRAAVLLFKIPKFSFQVEVPAFFPARTQSINGAQQPPEHYLVTDLKLMFIYPRDPLPSTGKIKNPRLLQSEETPWIICHVFTLALYSELITTMKCSSSPFPLEVSVWDNFSFLTLGCARPQLHMCLICSRHGGTKTELDMSC